MYTSRDLLPHQAPFVHGALVRIDDRSGNKITETVAFQYNPAQLVRQISARSYSDQPNRVTDLPAQSISLSLQLESTFTNFVGNAFHPSHAPPPKEGLLPQLDALELLMSPPSDAMTAYRRQLKSGRLAAVPPSLGRTLLIWGPRRVMPVLLQSIRVTEQVFDRQLTPVRAMVEVSLQVQSLAGASPKEEDYLLSYLKIQERRARTARLSGSQATHATTRVALS